MEHALTPTADPAWALDADGFDPLRESSVESRFAISNGFLGIRAARAITRGASWVVPPRTYVAGLFDAPGAEPLVTGVSRARTGCRSASCCPADRWCITLVMCPRTA